MSIICLKSRKMNENEMKEKTHLNMFTVCFWQSENGMKNK